MTPSFFALGLLVIASVVQPKSTVIVDSKENFGSEPIGNVKVTFADGHAEMWTRLGKCAMPKVSITRLVGWVKFENRGYRNYPIFDTLRVCWPDEHHKDFKADETYPFIEKWAFADNGTAVIIKSRAAHGPADFLKYRLSDAEVLGHAHESYAGDLPAWVKAFED